MRCLQTYAQKLSPSELGDDRRKKSENDPFMISVFFLPEKQKETRKGFGRSGKEIGDCLEEDREARQGHEGKGGTFARSKQGFVFLLFCVDKCVTL